MSLIKGLQTVETPFNLKYLAVPEFDSFIYSKLQKRPSLSTYNKGHLDVST